MISGLCWFTITVVFGMWCVMGMFGIPLVVLRPIIGVPMAGCGVVRMRGLGGMCGFFCRLCWLLRGFGRL